MNDNEKKLRDAIVAEANSWIGTPYHDYAGVKRTAKTKGGVDCAFFPLRVMQAVGLVDPKYKPKWYSPQQWINSPSQTDRFHLRVVDDTMLKIVKQLTKREIYLTPHGSCKYSQHDTLYGEFLHEQDAACIEWQQTQPVEVPQPGDLMLCQVINSWTHAAIIIKWPELVLHPVNVGAKQVCGNHALNEGFWANTPKRFFSMFDKAEEKK
jgi:cell wall-associated NlpC family hydrolase